MGKSKKVPPPAAACARRACVAPCAPSAGVSRVWDAVHEPLGGAKAPRCAARCARAVPVTASNSSCRCRRGRVSWAPARWGRASWDRRRRWLWRCETRRSRSRLLLPLPACRCAGLLLAAAPPCRRRLLSQTRHHQSSCSCPVRLLHKSLRPGPSPPPPCCDPPSPPPRPRSLAQKQTPGFAKAGLSTPAAARSASAPSPPPPVSSDLNALANTVAVENAQKAGYWG